MSKNWTESTGFRANTEYRTSNTEHFYVLRTIKVWIWSQEASILAILEWLKSNSKIESLKITSIWRVIEKHWRKLTLVIIDFILFTILRKSHSGSVLMHVCLHCSWPTDIQSNCQKSPLSGQEKYGFLSISKKTTFI